jgi:hypothetical protein
MSIVDQLQAALGEGEQELMKEASFRELQAFYQEMIRLGIAVKKPYELPQLDTVWRSLSQSIPSQFRSST